MRSNISASEIMKLDSNGPKGPKIDPQAGQAAFSKQPSIPSHPSLINNQPKLKQSSTMQTLHS